MTTKWEVEFATNIRDEIIRMTISSCPPESEFDDGVADAFALAVMGRGSVRSVSADCREYRSGDPRDLVEAPPGSGIGPWVQLQRWR